MFAGRLADSEPRLSLVPREEVTLLLGKIHGYAVPGLKARDKVIHQLSSDLPCFASRFARTRGSRQRVSPFWLSLSGVFFWPAREKVNTPGC